MAWRLQKAYQVVMVLANQNDNGNENDNNDKNSDVLFLCNSMHISPGGVGFGGLGHLGISKC